eukprot:scaffold153174_cov32-Tisochrysis_lutea.AAC.4
MCHVGNLLRYTARGERPKPKPPSSSNPVRDNTSKGSATAEGYAAVPAPQTPQQIQWHLLSHITVEGKPIGGLALRDDSTILKRQGGALPLPLICTPPPVQALTPRIPARVSRSSSKSDRHRTDTTL